MKTAIYADKTVHCSGENITAQSLESTSGIEGKISDVYVVKKDKKDIIIRECPINPVTLLLVYPNTSLVIETTSGIDSRKIEIDDFREIMGILTEAKEDDLRRLRGKPVMCYYQYLSYFGFSLN